MTILQDTINSFRVAAQQAPATIREGKKKILGYNYTLDLKDSDQNDVVIFLAEIHQIGDIILDHKITGKRGEVLRREQVVKTRGKAIRK